MSVGITLLLLVAALTHAVWNAFVKDSRDPVAMASWAYAAAGLPFAPLMFFLPVLPPEGWVLMAIHLVLHLIYKIVLVQMYRTGDLSQVYPVARGVTPLLVTLIAIPAASELPPPVAVTGIAVVSAGLMVFAAEPGALARARIAPLAYAFGAGIVASAYLVVDGLGVRLPGYFLSYMVTLLVLDGVTMAVLGLVWRGRDLGPAMIAEWRRGVLTAVLSIVSFVIALWVVSFTAMGPVSAVRETSVVFAAIIGAAFMGEAFGRRRILGAAVIALGIVLVNWPTP
ncbi:MAG: DMT family transporter [Alphaproteobacteria bacterium]|jgi:drug/metabolite transporter (DMT)-like permease|nr:DMT family transporter [Alphaproteobacteria bacterium]